METKKDRITLLRKKGLRATSQRMIILDVIENAGHIDIDKMYEILKKIIPSISLATIYKNIHSLVEADIIQEVRIKDRKVLYEVNYGDHIHFVCSTCGDVEDMDIDAAPIFSLLKQLSDRDVQEQKIILYGSCSKCC